MAKFEEIELANGQWVYMQVDGTLTSDSTHITRASDDEDVGFVRKGGSLNSGKKVVSKLEDVIRAMSDTAAKALQDSALGNVEKVTLEFGVTLSGEVGFFVSGKAEGSVNVTVEFAPKKLV